jgi:hypothetical protein
MGLDSLSTLMFNGSPNDMPSSLNGNVGSNTMSGDALSMTSGSSSRGTLSDSTQKLLGDADKVIAEFGKKYDVQLQQGQGGHGDRVVNANRIYDKLKASDPAAAKEFLAQMGKIGKPLGLNFGLREIDSKGGVGNAVNADAAKSLKGEQRSEHDKLASQWQQDRAATQRSGPPRQPQQNNALGNLLNNVASLNRNGNPDKIGLEEVQRALASPGLQAGEKQALAQLGKVIQHNGSRPVSVQQAMSLLDGSRVRSDSAGLSSMRQQGGWPNV